jgi:hypothetical protein
MFDHVRSRIAFADRLGFLLVALIVLVGIAAVPLINIDFSRPLPTALRLQSAATARADSANEQALVLRVAPKKADVSTIGSL